MNDPAITVLMPVYNGENFLHEAIESILQQTFTDFEFLIINDGSTDKSEEIILSYADPRIRYVKNEKNIKLIASLNKGIEISGGKYIARMDADDVSLPHRLHTQFTFMEQNPTVAVCGSWFMASGNNEKVVKYSAAHNEIMAKMLYQCHICHPTVIMRKSMIDTFILKFDSTFLHAEDYDFFVRVGEKFKLANIQEVLLKYRVHEQSVSAKNREIQQINSEIIKKRTFQKIGVFPSEKELIIYDNIAYQRYDNNVDFLNTAQFFFEKLLLANEESGFFEKSFLKKHLGQLWFNVVYNNTSLGMVAFKTYYASVLLNFKKNSFIQRIKFLIKSITKI